MTQLEKRREDLLKQIDTAERDFDAAYNQMDEAKRLLKHFNSELESVDIELGEDED